MKTLLLIIVLAVAGFIVASKRRARGVTSGKEEDSRPKASRSSPFHAVALQIKAGACREAQALKGKRFLSDEAPPLPLPGCTSVDCQCRFVHFSDRRSAANRRSEIPRGSGMLDETGEQRIERRKGRDRRRDPGDDEDDDFF